MYHATIKYSSKYKDLLINFNEALRKSKDTLEIEDVQEANGTYFFIATILTDAESLTKESIQTRSKFLDSIDKISVEILEQYEES